MELTARKEKILGLVVEHYIETGEPVGSKFLSDRFETSISSATVRNEMSDLSYRGFLEQPYTSAGRIPSQLGYRYYIDRLMKSYIPQMSEQYQMLSGIDRIAAVPEKVLKDACSVLSDMTECAVVATTPLDERTEIKRAELVPLGKNKAMIAIVTSTGVVKTDVCASYDGIDIGDAELFYNICANDFTDKKAIEINLPRLQSIVASLGDKALNMSPILVSLYELASSSYECELIVKGQSNILRHREYEGRVNEMSEFISDEKRLKRILRKFGDGVNVLLGTESGYRETENSAIIACPYSIGDRPAGKIALIGPMRMDYARYTAELEFMCNTVNSVLETVNIN